MGVLGDIHELEKSMQWFEPIRKKIVQGDESYKKDIEELKVAICLTDEKGYYRAVNESYCKLYGYGRKELIGNHFSLVVPHRYREMQGKKYFELFAAQNNVDGQWKVKQKSGKEMLVLVKGQVFQNDQNERLQLSMVIKIEDISIPEAELHRSVEQLNQHVEALKNKMAAQEMAESLMMHDLKKPLRNILGMLDMLNAHELPPEEVKVWYESMQKQSRKALHLLESLDGLRKMESGTFQPDFDDLDLVQLFQNLHKELKPMIDSKNLNFELIEEPDAEDFVIQGDSLFWERMAFNLLTNAIEASPEHETVTVKLHKNSRMIVKIHNQGAVPEAIRDQFFEKYVSFGKSRGTGLGTYLAKLIADVHHGNISMNTSEEAGTEIVLEFPLETASNN